MCEKITAPGYGRTKIVVVLTNGTFSGKRNAIESWAGADTPMVENVRFTYDDATGDAGVEWDLTSENGGFIDPSAVTYNVTRFPDMVVVAENIRQTSLTDNIGDVKYGGYYYNVIPVSGGENGIGANSNVLRIGKPFDLPYSEDFDNEQARNLYTIFDANNDGNSWVVNDPTIIKGRLAYNNGKGNDADDWALTPPLHMEKDYMYKLRFNVCGVKANLTEILSVYAGKGEDVSEYSEIMPATEIHSTLSNPTDTLINMTVPSDGDYSIAFRCTSPGTSKALFIDDVHVEKSVHKLSPRPVENLTLTPAEDGELEMTIDFDTPTLNNLGETLGQISRIEVARGHDRKIVETIESPVPGTHITMVDKDAVNGNLTYYVTAYSEYGAGETSEATAYVGIDSPSLPENIRICDNLDGTATIRWDAPSVGQHGGYVEADDVIYSVSVYDSQVGLEEIITGLEETEAIVEIPEQGIQQQMFFYIKAMNELGTSELANAPSIKVGSPYRMPFTEGFVKGNLSGLWISKATEDGTAEAVIFGGETLDGDNSLGGGIAYETGSWASLTSANISMVDRKRPMLVFSRMSTPGIDNTLKVIVRKNGGLDSETILTFNDKDSKDTQDWQIVKYDLSAYKDARYLDVTFLFEFNDMGYPYVLIDDVNFVDVMDYDVAVSINAPYHATVGDDVRFDVTVFNTGDKDTDSFQVDVFVDGDKAGTLNMESVASFRRATYGMEYKVQHKNDESTQVWAEVVYDKDNNADNDCSDYKTMKVSAPLHNAPADLSASVESGKILLNWSEPDSGNTVTESFEGYGSFMTDGFGGWTTYDGDESPTTTISGIDFPHSGEKFAFMTFDFESLGVSNPLYAGHSGTQVALSMMGTSYNDDWLISPELSGDRQTITMYVRSMSGYKPGMYEVRYSDSDPHPDKFNGVAYEGVFEYDDEDWNEISVELPEGTRYFAVRNIGRNGGMFMVDDITYTGKPLTLTGYKIYRDAELIGHVDSMSRDFITDPVDGRHTYNVTAVYSEGESGFSNGVDVDMSGIELIDTDSIEPGYIYDLAGRRMPAGRKLEKGVYIRNHEKVLVK